MNTDIFAQLQHSGTEAAKRWVVVQALLGSVDTEVAEAAIAAAVPHWFNPHILAALLETDQASCERLDAGLRNLPVTERFGPLGHTLHDLTRSSIILHLREHKPTLFLTYSSRAHSFFVKDQDPQSQVEAIYHLLACNAPEALIALRERLWTFRSTLNYAAASNLLRNGEELAVLRVVDDTIVAELERQKYLIAADVLGKAPVGINLVEVEPHLAYAKKLFGDHSSTAAKQMSDSQLYAEPFNLQKRRYVEKKLNDAIGKHDDLRQGIWLDALATIDREEAQFQAALDRYAEALAINSKNSLNLRGRGQTYRLMGRYDEALADFTRAIEIRGGWGNLNSRDKWIFRATAA